HKCTTINRSLSMLISKLVIIELLTNAQMYDTLNAGVMIGEIDNHWELGFNYEHSLSNIFKPNQPYTHNGQALMLFPNNSSKFGTLSFYFAITF
ncbi:hypothetical protein, partial [Tannerella forsythia]|uniref:hypothetical protein n=1 Tax=Tannerella forsythia TaxID=28112 RepID=UPI001C88E27B